MRAAQEAFATHDREQLEGLKTITPEVTFQDAPLKPLREHRADRSVLLGRSPFMTPGDGLGDASMPVYEPVEDGGFRVTNGQRTLNRPIVHGQNRVWTGDVPLFSMDTVAGNGSYAKERVYPLWPRPDAEAGNVTPAMGRLRLGVIGSDGATDWLDTFGETTATFRPGYTLYEISTAEWKATIRVAPVLDSHGMICRVTFDKPVRLTWRYGGVWWNQAEKNANHAEIRGNTVRITEANLPNNLVIAGWNTDGDARLAAENYGDQAEFVAREPRDQYAIVGVWGITKYDEPRAKRTLARLDTPNAAAWPEARDKLKAEWFDCYIGRALAPERRFEELMAAPDAALDQTCRHWDARRAEFQIHTPDARLNALINWTRCTTDYHRQGPGLVLGAQIWQMYSHISTGWYGKQWGGDHETIASMLRFYGAMQGRNDRICWISPSLATFDAENNTPYWVDQVWRHFTWTGDTSFVRDLWPAVRKTVAWQRAEHDPDGDGLFQDWYEYWNCDSNGKGPKSVVPSAMSWRMLECAANLAHVVGDADAENEYRNAAAKTHDAMLRELWREDEGRLGCIGADGLWRGHPQTWEEYLPIMAGLLTPEQGRRSMRWLDAHYGFTPQPGVRLLACSDWYPTRWSVQWVPTGDTCLAALAGMLCGDVAQWYPYLETAVGSAFRSEFPGINMAIANTGAGGGEREDVDSVDPYTHAVVRGLFGIEPALHVGRLDICPAFPAEWTEASITTPDVRYTYKREGDSATFHIVTPKPCIKQVRANLTGVEVITPDETDSTVTVTVGVPVAPPEPRKEEPILMTAFKRETKRISHADRAKLTLVDLSKACNRTVETMITDRYVYDYSRATETAPVAGWWGNPWIVMPPGPRAVEAPNGVPFLTSGRSLAGGMTPNGLVALSSWRPYPLPGGARIPIGMRCARAWLLLQGYVHPMKNYVANGEVVLRYAGGREDIVPLIPPYNLDTYFQHFSLESEPVPMGSLVFGNGAVEERRSAPHADALEIPCDPAVILDAIELRATCSEGILGLAGLTLQQAE